jgi:hypothetical protein
MHNTHDAFVSAESVPGHFGSGQFTLHFGHARFQTGLVVFQDVQPAARNIALLDRAAQLVAAQVGFLPHGFQLLKKIGSVYAIFYLAVYFLCVAIFIIFEGCINEFNQTHEKTIRFFSKLEIL